MRLYAAVMRPLSRTIAVSLVLIVALGTPAAAGGPVDPVGGETKLGTTAGLRYLRESLTVGSSGGWSNPYEGAEISCGGHSSPWHPASGGSKVSGSADANTISGQRSLDLDAAFESPDNAKPDDFWEVVVRSVVGRTLTGVAICSRSTFRYRTVEAQSGTSTNRGGSAHCPSTHRVVGGGAFIATTNSFVNSSFPTTKNSWRSRIYDSVGGAGGMYTQVVCLRKPHKVVRKGAHKSGITAGSAATVTARCPKGRHVIGGGGRWSGSIDRAWLATSLPIDARDSDSVPDDGWRVTGYNSAGGNKTLTAFALCVSRG
jgi:hypothetical protein